jgi:hypothetical protein
MFDITISPYYKNLNIPFITIVTRSKCRFSKLPATVQLRRVICRLSPMANCKTPLLSYILRRPPASHHSFYPCDTLLNDRAQTLLLLTVELQVLETSSHRTIETGDMSTNCKGNFVTLATLLYASTLSSLTSFDMSMP